MGTFSGLIILFLVCVLVCVPNPRVSSVLYIPTYSYIWKTILYIPIYSYIWKTVLYIPIFQGKQEMSNSYLKQMLLISNTERCKFVILQHLLSVNTSVVTEDRPHVGEVTVYAIRTVKDAVEFFDPVSQQSTSKKFPSQESSLEVLKWYMPATDRD